MRRDGYTHSLGKSSSCAKVVQDWSVAVRHAHRAIHNYHNCLAWVTDFALGQRLIAGNVCHPGNLHCISRQAVIRRSAPEICFCPHVAIVGRGRKWHWRTDGWTFSRVHLCAYYQARRARVTVFPRTRLDQWTRSIDGRRTGAWHLRTGRKEIAKVASDVAVTMSFSRSGNFASSLRVGRHL